MPESNSGSVVKLNIEAHKLIDCSSPISGKTIELQVNPETIAFEYGISFGADSSSSSSTGASTEMTSEAAAGESAPVLGAPQYEFPDLNIKTYIDATGVLPDPLDITLEEDGKPSVAPFITKLKDVVYNYIDDTHGPPFLKVMWGKVLPSSANQDGQVDGVFRGRLSKLGIEYTLFGKSGNPVRAEINLTIKSAIDPAARPGGESPDLTHFIDIQYGDNLPKLCKDIYGSPEFFLQIAKINNLPSIYAIEPGMKLLFPPLDKASR